MKYRKKFDGIKKKYLNKKNISFFMQVDLYTSGSTLIRHGPINSGCVTFAG